MINRKSYGIKKKKNQTINNCFSIVKIKFFYNFNLRQKPEKFFDGLHWQYKHVHAFTTLKNNCCICCKTFYSSSTKKQTLKSGCIKIQPDYFFNMRFIIKYPVTWLKTNKKGKEIPNKRRRKNNFNY